MSMSIDRDLMINQLGNVDAFEAAGLPVKTAWNSIISCLNITNVLALCIAL